MEIGSFVSDPDGLKNYGFRKALKFRDVATSELDFRGKIS